MTNDVAVCILMLFLSIFLVCGGAFLIGIAASIVLFGAIIVIFWIAWELMK